MSLRTCDSCQMCYANQYIPVDDLWACYECIEMNYGELTFEEVN